MTAATVKLIIELKDMVTSQLEKINKEMETIEKSAKEVQTAMKQFSNDGFDGDRINNDFLRLFSLFERFRSQSETTMNSARNSQINFNNSVVRSNTVLGELQSSLRTVGVNGQSSFNQLSNAQRKSLMEFSSLDTKSRNLAQRINEIGISGQSSFNQLSTAEKKAITEMNNLNQSTNSVINNFSRFNMTAQAAQTALHQLDLDPSLNAGIQSAKVQVSSLGGDITSTKGKLQTLGIAAKTSLSGGFNQAVTAAKNSLSGLKASVSSAKIQMTSLNQSSRLAGGGLGFLRSAASMTVGMIGYDLVNSMVQSARESINAAGNFQAFGKRMNMSSSEIQLFSKQCDTLQQSFKKVDMKAVGASALELGVKLKLPKESMVGLTKTVAVMSSAFVKEGRTQTDAILAVSDALDGQFRRMQELGISQEMLKNNGWDGDINNKTSLLQAMNKTLEEMGFTETAMQVNTLDEAYQMLSVSGGQLLSSIIIPLTPALINIATAVVGVIEGIKDFIGQLQTAWQGLPDWAQEAITIGILAGAVLLLIGYISSLGGIVSILTTAFAPLIGAIAAINAPMIAAVAIIAAITFAVYELGKAFGWWNDVGSMIDAIKNNIGRLWDAFINHPDVQALIKGIQEAWQGLNDFLKPVIDWLKGIWDEIFPPSAKGKVDGTRMVIDAIGMAFSVLKTILSPTISIIGGVISILGALWNAAQPVGQGIYNALKPIICVLLGCSPGIVPALRKVQEVFNTVFSAISGFIGGLVSSIISAIQPIIDFLSATFGPALEGIGQLLSGNIVGALGSFKESLGAVFDALGPVGDILESIIMPLFSAFIALLSGDANSAMTAFRGVWEGILDAMGPVGDFIGEYLTPVFYGLVNIFMAVWGAVQNIIGVFQAFLSGQISLPEALGQIWGIISQLLSTIFTIIISTITQFARNMWDKACTAGSNVLQGVSTFIQQLPGKVWTWIVQTASKIIAGGARWVTNAKAKAHATVIGVMSYVNQLPGKVFNEFMNIGSKILQAGGALVEKAKKIGKDIVNGILNAMGIHSPGTIQKKVVNEFVAMIDRVGEKHKLAKESAKKVGDAIVDGFNKSDVEKQLNDVTSDIELPTPEPTSAKANAEVDVNTDDTKIGNGEEYATFTEDVQLASESISTSNAFIRGSFMSMTAGISSDASVIQSKVSEVVSGFNNTRINVDSSLTQMKTSNNAAWQNITTVTQNNLNTIYKSTADVTKKLTNAWTVMKNNIVNAAADLRNKANAHFNNLSSNIGSFYRRIQNPHLWGGPSSGTPTASRGAVSGSTGRLRSIISSAVTPSFAGTAPLSRLVNTFCSTPQCKEFYLTPNNHNEMVDVEEFYKRNHNSFAGWGDWAPKHLSHIKNRTGNWKMKGPVIRLLGGIPTGLAFSVKQFLNGSRPSMGMESFTRIAEAIFSRIPYDYYLNSDKTGNPITALESGSCNCWDGAHSLMALANLFGFSSSLAHGKNHVWAVINGKTFDTTNYQKHRSWSPLPGYSGPSLRKVDNEITVTKDEVTLTIDHNLNLKVESDGEVEIDKDSLLTTLKKVISDSKLIDKIAEALIKRDNKISRMKGVA